MPISLHGLVVCSGWVVVRLVLVICWLSNCCLFVWFAFVLLLTCCLLCCFGLRVFCLGFCGCFGCLVWLIVLLLLASFVYAVCLFVGLVSGLLFGVILLSDCVAFECLVCWLLVLCLVAMSLGFVVVGLSLD